MREWLIRRAFLMLGNCNCFSQRWNMFCLFCQYSTWKILDFSEYYHILWSPWSFKFFPHETRRETGKPLLLRAMSAHQIFFITIVHFNKILGIFDKPASREQSCYKMTYLKVPAIIFGLRILLGVFFLSV